MTIHRGARRDRREKNIKSTLRALRSEASSLSGFTGVFRLNFRPFAAQITASTADY
jgi:hypothetical protein